MNAQSAVRGQIQFELGISNSNMSIVDDTLNIYQRIWHFLGLWYHPTQRNRRWFTVYSSIVRFIVLIVYNMCFILALTVANRIEDVIETMPILASTLSAAFKAWIFLRTRRDISLIINIMKRLEVDFITDLTERSILLAAKRKSTVATVFFSCAAGLLRTLLAFAFSS